MIVENEFFENLFESRPKLDTAICRHINYVHPDFLREVLPIYLNEFKRIRMYVKRMRYVRLIVTCPFLHRSQRN